VSLLPGQILPPSTPLGRVNPDGTVTVEQNWWLLLYNLCAQTLGTGTTGLPASALEAIEATDLDVVGSDIPSIIRQVNNLQAQFPEADVVPALREITNALMMAIGQIEESLPFNGFAPPSALVGLTAVSGIASTGMRSDGAPAIDQSIAPQWTGIHTFTNNGAPVRAQPVTSAGFAIVRCQNESSVRRLEMVFCGSTSAGAYGAAAGTCVINAQGGLTLSVADVAAMALDASGNAKFIKETGFNNTAPIAKPTVTGSRGGNAALASLLTALANYGLVTDSSTP
jgi:hypothetical protein